jgi:hypothetical protein
MLKRIPYGQYTPDLPPIVNQQGLIKAENVVPINGGYGPLRSLETVTDATPLNLYCRGALGGIDFSGNPYNVAGDKNDLYSVDSNGATVKSRSIGYDTGVEGRWEFAAFGETVFGTNYTDDLQQIEAGHLSLDGQVFSDVSDLSIAQAVPRARHLGVIDNFLVLGNIFDPVLGNQPGGISWSAINNPLSWPERGTDAAVAVQSDHQILEGNGGWVHAVVPGSEVGAIFQEHAIWRMDYVGGDVVFALRRVEPNRGLLIPGLAVPVSRWVFYLSEDGFYLFDYTQSKPIGKDRINKTFFNDWDSSYPDRVSAIRDPDQTRIYVLYPGAGHTDGAPNRMLIYDWALDMFSHADVDGEMMAWALTSGADLDSPHIPIIDPDILGEQTGGAGTPDTDPPGNETFDKRVSPPGSLTLGAYDSTHTLSSFSGPNLIGTLETGDVEVNPGYRSLVNRVRPIVDSADATIQVAATGRKNQSFAYCPVSTQDDDGKCPVRVDGRYHRFKTSLPSTFTSAVGMDIDSRAAGRK